jgi:hypothetical protein
VHSTIVADSHRGAQRVFYLIHGWMLQRTPDCGKG